MYLIKRVMKLIRDIKIEEIRSEGIVIFSDGTRLSIHDYSDSSNSKINIFRIQIEETVKRHLRKQAELRRKGIKVLSLFFIDKVANYTSSDAIIPKLFDLAFDKYKIDYEEYKDLKGEDVREAYFAQKKNKTRYY